jgi:hypothetical protein
MAEENERDAIEEIRRLGGDVHGDQWTVEPVTSVNSYRIVRSTYHDLFPGTSTRPRLEIAL